MENRYHGYFADWDDVVSEFGCDEKEPDEVIFAIYNYHCYDGDAIVIYRNRQQYFIVEGCHCSCHGLEGQWYAKTYNKKELKEVIKVKKFYEFDDVKPLIEELKKYVEEI